MCGALLIRVFDNFLPTKTRIFKKNYKIDAYVLYNLIMLVYVCLCVFPAEKGLNWKSKLLIHMPEITT